MNSTRTPSSYLRLHRPGVTALLGLCAALAPLGCGSTSKNGGASSGGADADGGNSSSVSTSNGNAASNGAGGVSNSSATSSQAGTDAGGSSSASGGSSATSTGGRGGAGGTRSSGVGGGGGVDDDCDCAPGDLQCTLRCAGSPGLNSGDCKDDLDCDGDESCVELSPGGYRVCASEPPEFTACDEGYVYSCCGNDECDGGRCALTSGTTCQGAGGEPYAVCATDQCQTADDCSDLENGVCFPVGAYGRIASACVAGGCRTDDDCSEGANGRCLLVQDPCCLAASVSLVCVYDDGCRTSADCPDSGYCHRENGTSFCASTPQACPF